jgi:hypothetical protein
MSDRFVIAGLIVLVTNSQGKLRQVPLTLKQSGRVRRFVSKLHEGGLHIAPEDLLLLTEKDALETFGKLTGKLPFWEKWKLRLARLKDVWFSYPNPLTKVARAPAKQVRFESSIEDIENALRDYEQRSEPENA